MGLRLGFALNPKFALEGGHLLLQFLVLLLQLMARKVEEEKTKIPQAQIPPHKSHTHTCNGEKLRGHTGSSFLTKPGLLASFGGLGGAGADTDEAGSAADAPVLGFLRSEESSLSCSLTFFSRK